VPRKLKTRLLLILVGILLLYVLGIFVRQRYGVSVVVRNEGAGLVQKVGMKFDGWEYHYKQAVPDLLPGQRFRLFVNPRQKSYVTMEFTGPDNARYHQISEDYVYPNECDSLIFTVDASGRAEAGTVYHHFICGDSWFGFVR
jgi:hypothetical protein